MMRVGDRDRERVGGVGAGDLHAGKQARDHRVDLRLVGAAGADDRLLDQRAAAYSPTSIPARAAHISTTPRAWPSLSVDCGFWLTNTSSTAAAVGPVLGDHRLELLREPGQPLRQRRRRIGLDLPVGDMSEAVAVGLDQPPAGRAEAGIEAEDPQASFSSSSSGTS